MSDARAIDKVRAAFSRKTRSIVIPEWDGLELFFGPLTTADLDAVEARQPKTVNERNLLLLIHKARDKDGATLFSFGDLHYLRTEAAMAPLNQAFEAMYGVTVDLDAARQELETNPPSGSASA